MPNDCDNQLIISGNKKILDKFLYENKNDKYDLDFSKSVPPNFMGTDLGIKNTGEIYYRYLFIFIIALHLFIIIKSYITTL